MSTSEQPREQTGAEPRQEPSAQVAQAAAGDPAHPDLAGVPPTSPVGRLAATVDRLRREVRTAQAEAEGRALVELAKGILVERLRCGPAQAARQLAELAEQASVSPLEFAVEVINQAARDRVSEVTDAFLAAAAGAPERDAAAVRLRAAESGALAADDT
ncbi:ANTAR domain-containing protein, partial [Streptomyces seoulensis]